MLLFILLLWAILFLYLAIKCLIEGIFEYKISSNIANILRDKNTRKMFVYLRPYMDEFLEQLRKNRATYAYMIELYRKYINKL